MTRFHNHTHTQEEMGISSAYLDDDHGHSDVLGKTNGSAEVTGQRHEEMENGDQVLGVNACERVNAGKT